MPLNSGTSEHGSAREGKGVAAQTGEGGAEAGVVALVAPRAREAAAEQQAAVRIIKISLAGRLRAEAAGNPAVRV